MALGSACTSNKRDFGTPFRIAISMAGEVSSLITAVRVMRAICAMIVNERAATGSASIRASSKKSESGRILDSAGNHPNCTEKMDTSISAIRKSGTEMRVKVMAEILLSTRPLGLMEAIRPSKMDNGTATRAVTPARRKVLLLRSAINTETSRPETSEVPISPCSKLPNQWI